MTSRTAPIEIPGWTHVYSGKVRDLYVPEESRYDAAGLTISDDAEVRAGSVMVVASDRISAFDKILPTEIPDKGAVLTQLSLWWFKQLGDVPNHVLSTDVPDEVAGRAMICQSLNMFPLVNGSRLKPPIFTPTGKAEVGEHDEMVTRQELWEEVGEAVAERLEELTLYIYTTAEKIAREQGIILADTKVEFGTDSYRGEITLGDELLTPDSSRFWDASEYEPGKSQPSFDKQYVRDWLRSPEAGWDGSNNVPHLPEAVVEKTRARYIEAYERLTGTKF